MEPGYSSSGRPGMGPSYGQPVGGQPMYGPHMGGMPPHGMPPHGMPPQGVPPSQAMIVNQTQPQVVNVVSGQTFGTKPVSITCQFCKNPVTTTVNKTCNCCTCCLCFMTGFIFWVCIQCCRNKEINCWDATHVCPSCGQQLGTYTSC